MKKNENGFPCFNLPSREGELQMQKNAVGNQSLDTDFKEKNDDKVMPRQKEGCSQNSRGRDTNNGAEAYECDQVPLAYVYAPMQKFCMLYSTEEALNHGTLFENLYKPLGVYGNE